MLGVDFLVFAKVELLVEAFDHALLIWFRRWENLDIPRDEKLGELGTDFGLKRKCYSYRFHFYKSKLIAWKRVAISLVIIEIYLGPSRSGTWRKFELFGFDKVGGDGAALAKISATGT